MTFHQGRGLTAMTDQANSTPTYQAIDIAHLFEEIAPKSLGNPGDSLGFIYGSPDTHVNGIGCLWNIHHKSLVMAIEKGLNMLICHEAIWMEPQDSSWYDGPAEYEIKPNLMRRELLDRHGIVVYRSHSNWDALPGDGIVDQAIEALGLSGLSVVSRQKYFGVHRLPESMTVKALADRAAEGLGYDGCRVFGDAAKTVRQFSFLIGGFGGNQFHMPQAAKELGSEAIIIGEMSEFIAMGALELGMPVIETLHSVSEMPGIRRQAEVLGKALPDLRVEFIPSGILSYSERGTT